MLFSIDGHDGNDEFANADGGKGQGGRAFLDS